MTENGLTPINKNYTLHSLILKISKRLTVNLLLNTFLILTISLNAYSYAETSKPYYNLAEFDQGIVISHKKIPIPDMEYALNPSIIEWGDNFLMTFRYQRNFRETPWISEIALVPLDQNFDLAGEIQLLDIRKSIPHIPCRAEDARIIVFNEKIYVIYNDNIEEAEGHPSIRREIYIVEVIPLKNGRFDCETPVLLKHPKNFPEREAEKNWTPFIYNDKLLLEYTLQPHEILLPNLETGECEILHKIDYELPLANNFTWNDLRGGTPAILDGSNYLAFFHSYKIASSSIAAENVYHYFMGAYTFSASPPFLINAVSTMPIFGNDLYTDSNFHKRVVYPGGFVQSNNRIYVVYGKDDQYTYVMILDKEKLMDSLRPVSYNYQMPEDFFSDAG